MRSFGLLRTNVGLTTNIKITIDSDYNLSLDSIESNEQLSDSKYKRVKFSKSNFYDELIPYFFKEVPSEIAFDIKYDNDIDTISSDFSNQYDEIYNCGARNISNNKEYIEEFEYFAPLYIKRNSLPKKFVIFRVDGPGIQLINSNNFSFEIVNKFKTVKIFDLTNKTRLGQWLETNFTLNNSFPDAPLEFDFRNLEFSKWNGIDYQTGGYSSKSIFLNDYLDEEKEIFELERFVFDSYKRNKIVFPNIVNLNFLFDDEPATPDEKRKWSINRYFGFYLDDLELITTLSPYITPFLKDDVVILDGNVIYSPTNEDPFVEGFSFERPFYVEYNGNYYTVEQFEEEGEPTLVQITTGNVVNEVPQSPINIKYRIISDIDLSNKQSELNQNFGYIKDNILYNYDNTELEIDDFDLSDVWIIEIDGIHHNLIKDGTSIKVNSDYSFTFNQNDYTYKNAGLEQKISFVVDFNNPPKYFNIYRCKFTDIKDFDTRIVDTEYSKFEYEKLNDITTTEETKMYVEDLTDDQFPRRFEDYIFNDEVENIPTSSEYTANHETFKIENGDLSPIWRKNSIYCRWAFQNSTSGNDYPYLLNNSLIFEDYNRSVNPFDPDLKRIERNLDYFYTINSSTSSYEHHTLHIEKQDNDYNIDNSFQFELEKYLNLATYSVGTVSATYSYDYFSQFFEQNQLFLSGKKKVNVKKYSEFNKGDNSIPNQTLFRGIKFSIYDLDSINISEDGSQVEKVNLRNSNTFEDYKFSILLSDNNVSIDNNGNLINSNNSMSWRIINNWEMDKTYATNSIVLFDGILYESIAETIITSPIVNNNGKKVKSTPYNSSDWVFTSPLPSLSTVANPIFWSPNYFYLDNDLVYNNGEYYYHTSAGTDDFWNPNNSTIGASGYNLGDVVLYKGIYYMSLTSSNILPPDYKRPLITRINNTISASSATIFKYWTATQSSSPKWNKVPLWSANSSYNQNQLIIHNDIVYLSSSTTSSSDVPGVSTLWQRTYSLLPDTNFNYQPNNQQTGNPIIEMNDEFYMIESNVNSSTLDNGIVIYINKKWKNILININVSDNTLSNLTNTDRDNLYENIYKKLSAFNFIQAVNDISNKYDFTDYITYVVIGDDNSIKRYNLSNNITELPHIIQCELPDEFEVKINSLTKKAIMRPEKLKSSFSLVNNRLVNISQLNWYNGSNIASDIKQNEFEPTVFKNFHGNKNIKSDIIYRFSGYYMPLFYDIELFNKDIERTLIGNYKFDTTLTNFGIIRERKFRKINRTESILKLSNDLDFKSIYPMLDEFGLTYDNSFIFTSTWDLNYHLESYKPKSGKVIIELPTITSQVSSTYGQPISVQSQNNQTL
jgi:hypothetical protein